VNKRVALVLVLVALIASFSVGVPRARADGDFWVSRASMPVASRSFGAAVVDGKVYVIGGKNAGNYLHVNEEYDPATDTWTTRASMPTPRYYLAVAVYQNKIYCIGGSNGTDPITGADTVTGANEVYDPATNTWASKVPMPTARDGLIVNVVNGKIYLIGGVNVTSGGPLNVNEVYDPATDSWATKSPIPIPVNFCASAVVDDRIYVMGGSPSNGVATGSNQIYDPATDNWASGKPLPTAVTEAAAGATTGLLAPKRIYVIGGRTSMDGVSSNQVYDLESDSWTIGASMPTARYELALAVVNDTLYALGGAFEPPFPIPPPSYSVNEVYIPAGYQGPIPTPSSPSPSPSPTESTTPIPTPSPTPSPSPNSSSYPSPSSQSTKSPAPQQPRSSSLYLLYVAAVGVATIAVVSALFVLRRRKATVPNYT
jgi:N-acetylneuraminic acid mutarotase